MGAIIDVGYTCFSPNFANQYSSFQSHEILFFLLCFMCGIFPTFHVSVWWVLILQHKGLVPLHSALSPLTFAPSQVPCPLPGTHSHLPSSLASTRPDRHQLVFSGSTRVRLALTPQLRVPGSALCSLGLCWLPLLSVSVSPRLGLPLLFLHEFTSSWRGWAVSLSSARSQHRTCGSQCLLNECSNSVSVTQNV